MRCCCSPFNFGINLGSLYIVGSVIVCVFQIFIYFENDARVIDSVRKDDLKSEALKTIIICGITILVSSLFIVAIVKRNHYLILPWLLFAVYFLYATLSFMYMCFLGAGLGGASGIVVLILLLITVSSIGIEIAIFCFSCSLFKKIRNENMEKFEKDEQQQMCDKNLI